MTRQIKSWVGRSVRATGRGNRAEDVEVVKKLLNEQIRRGKEMRNLKLLDLKDGNIDPMIKAIEQFQKKVLRLKKPDGRVDPKGLTYDVLKHSYGCSRIDVFILACNTLRQKPVGAINPNAWKSALRSLRDHASNQKLFKPHLMTLVDFTIPCNKKRMWIVNLVKQELLLGSPFLVAHGMGGGKNASTTKNRKNSIPKYFSNKKETNLSSVGAYVTLGIKGTTLGRFDDGKKRPTLVLEGLESTNNNAKSRGIYFHAAKYVQSKTKDVGMSHGCFATEESVNDKILPVIKNGSFVYAYGPSVRIYPRYTRYE